MKPNPESKFPPMPLFDGSSKLWHAEVGDLLAKAAIMCVEHGLDLDTFMKGAWSAYVEARPGMREHLDEIQLLSELVHARKHGRMGQA